MDPQLKTLVESLVSKVQGVLDNGDWPTYESGEVEELTNAIQDGLAGL